MLTCRSLLAVIAVLAASAGVVRAETAPDCSKAHTASEKAICSNAELSVADAAMAKAYDALLKTLPPGQQADLRRDQRDWITNRDGGCFDKKDNALAQCLLTATNMRRHFLAGEGDNGPAAAPALLPVYFTESRKGAYDITIAYPQFAGPATPSFNAAVHKLVFGKDVLSDYRQDKPNPFNGSSNFYQVSYDITYLDPHLAAVTLQFADYQGGAHPNGSRAALLWDLSADKPITHADFLADPDKAVPAVSAKCKAQAEHEDWGLFDKPDFDSVVKDPRSWAIDKDGATILFDAYSVAPYVAGPHECRLAYAELADWRPAAAEIGEDDG